MIRRLDTLTTTHMGRQVTVHGLTGTLAALLPVADTVQLVLIVGNPGVRCFTDALPGETEIEVGTCRA